MYISEKQQGVGSLTIFAIIAIIAVIAGVSVYMMGRSTANTAMQVTPSVTESPTTTTTSPEPTAAVSGDTSDTGLSKDSASVDTQLKAADQDSANVNAGLNDQQGNLSEQ